MTNEESKALATGLYRLSLDPATNGSRAWVLAAVGILSDGARWYAPCAWVPRAPAAVSTTHLVGSSNWAAVTGAELLLEALPGDGLPPTDDESEP